MSIFFRFSQLIGSFQAAYRLLSGRFQAYSRLWLEYGYSMAKAWDKECTVFSRPSLAFSKP